MSLLITHLLVLAICLEEFDRLSPRQKTLLTAVVVERESYDDFATRTGVYRPAIAQMVLSARTRLYSGIDLRLARDGLARPPRSGAMAG